MNGNDDDDLSCGMSREQYRGVLRLARGMELTTRQREIVVFVEQGKQTKEIAARLGIAVGTVKVHLANVYARCGVPNRCALAGLGLTRQWTPSQDLRSGQYAVEHF